MSASNLKTFIYSFSMSLLIIFIAKIFVMPKFLETTSSEKIVPNKNIALFLKKEEILEHKTTPVQTSLVLVSNLSDIKNYDTNISNILINFSSKQDSSHSEIVDINIDNEKLAEIFVDSAYNDIDAYELANDIINDKNIQYAKNEEIKPIEIEKIFEEQNIKLEKENPSQVAMVIEDNLAKDDIIPIIWNNNKTPNKNIKIAQKVEKDNSVAMSESSVPLKSLIENENIKKEQKTPNNSSDNPWVVATGKGASNNSLLQDTLNKEDKTTGADFKVAKMVKNILIPIPEDILNDADATPLLVTSDKNKELKEKIETNIIQKPSMVTKEEKIESESVSNIDDKKELATELTTTLPNENNVSGIKKEKKTIFDSITNIFSNNVKMPEIGVTKDKTNENRENSVFKEMSKTDKNDKNNKKVTKILPTEIKLSFQPNRSEISGPTLRWLEAFANKTTEDESIALEIRIDGTSSFELQQKRLGLLHNILTNKGVTYNKINTVFTAREANSFIIRTVRIDKQAMNANVNNRVTDDSKIYQSW